MFRILAAAPALAFAIALGGAGAVTGFNANSAQAQMEDRSIEEIRVVLDVVSEAGYRDIKEIERDGSFYEVEARNAEGQWYKLDVDPAQGEIVRERRDD